MSNNARTGVIMLCLGASLALGLAGCSSGGSGLITGSILPGSKPKVVDEPTERAILVATTSARAVKCGYNFDPARLRAGYLAHEATRGTSPDSLAKSEKTYDFTRDAVIKRIVQEGSDEFCDDVKTAEIKRDLTRFLAGDYTLPTKVAQRGFMEGTSRPPPIDRERLFDPTAAR